ncbi:NADAR domain-containing protein [Luedemannella flava]|uniref:NADAR domain-containing protein n=1 Tax=Luedemannella flava TaxID=349316 RepID=A0ABP4XVX8_9ACTN
MPTSLPYTVDELRDLVAAGAAVTYLHFWGHRPEADGRIGKGCLSQWWDAAPFDVDGVRYATAEHYMMAEKARLFGDKETAARIVAAASPGAAKALGRQVARFDDATWREHRSDIVVAGNRAKFGQHPELLAYLVGTRGRVLVEASPQDRIWGIGLAASDGRAFDPARWPGLNLLGFALMRVRAEFVDG